VRQPDEMLTIRSKPQTPALLTVRSKQEKFPTPHRSLHSECQASGVPTRQHQTAGHGGVEITDEQPGKNHL